MRQKTRIFIYILIAIAVVITSSITIINNHQKAVPASVQEHIDLGRIYLNELSYEKSILEFTEAIEIEPLNPDAYLGLAQAYDGTGDTEKVVEILEKGYDKTGDERLKKMLDDILNKLLPSPEETTVTTVVMTEETTTASTVAMATVPDLLGLTEEEAIAACEAAGLQFSISYDYSDTVEKGHVIGQTIPVNASVVEGISLPFMVSEGVKAVTTVATTTETTTVSSSQYYAEDFLGMTYKEVFQILGEGKLSCWNGGWGYYWKDLELELTAYQNEVIINYTEKVIIPEDAHVGLVYTWSESIPANKDLIVGMRLADVVNKYDLTESDIYTLDIDKGYNLFVDNKYSYSIYMHTSGENDYDEPITEIALQAKDYYEKSSNS